MRVDDFLRWPIDHPAETAVAFVVLIVWTVFGYTVKRVARRLGELAAAPAAIVESHLVRPALIAVKPWPLEKALFTGRRLLVAPTGPLRQIAMLMVGLAGRIPAAISGRMPVAVAGGVARLAEVFTRLSEAAGSGIPLGKSQLSRSLSQLGAHTGQKVVGALIFGAAAAGFALADAALIVDSFVALTPQVTTSGIPDFLKTSLVWAQSAASFLSVAMLGLILGDLIGLTHLGPWSETKGAPRFSLGLVATLLFLFVLFVSAAISLWRANEIQSYLSPELRNQLGAVARGWVQPLMLAVSALVFAGAVNTFVLFWFVVVTLAMVVLLVTRFVAQLLGDIAVPIATAVARFLSSVAIGAVYVAGIAALSMGAVVVAVAGYSAVGAVVLLGVASLLLWTWLWTAIGALTALLLLVIKGLFGFVEGSLDVTLRPGTLIWNWIASMRWLSQPLHLRPIGDIPAEMPPPQLRREVLVGKAVIG